jgi:hypothetical protein
MVRRGETNGCHEVRRGTASWSVAVEGEERVRRAARAARPRVPERRELRLCGAAGGKPANVGDADPLASGRRRIGSHGPGLSGS